MSNVHMKVVLLNLVGLLSYIKLLMAEFTCRRDIKVSKDTLFFLVNFQRFCELTTKTMLALTVCFQGNNFCVQSIYDHYELVC